MSKTVLVSGGADASGRDFSKLFARRSYRLLVADIAQDKLDEFADVLKRWIRLPSTCHCEWICLGRALRKRFTSLVRPTR